MLMYLIFIENVVIMYNIKLYKSIISNIYYMNNFEKMSSEEKTQEEKKEQDQEEEQTMKKPEYFDTDSGSLMTEEEHKEKIRQKMEDPFGDAAK